VNLIPTAIYSRQSHTLPRGRLTHVQTIHMS